MDRSITAKTTLMIALAVICLGSPRAAGASAEPDHGHGSGGGGSPRGEGRIGVLIADHGEPPVYNADTYESFRAFFEHLMEMGVFPSELRALDGGTVLQDRRCYGCDPQADPELIDAWLRPHDGPAAWAPAPSEDLAPHYMAAAGPGAGEPDIFEHIGLAVWHEWELMGGISPNYEQKLAKKRKVIRRLKHRYAERIAISVGYGIDPRIGGERQDLHAAVHALIDRGADRIAVVYHGVGFSDLMQTHMIRHEIEHSLAAHGLDVPITYADPIGATGAYVRSVVEKAQRELARLPRRAPVALHLSGHGLPTDTCWRYDCGADSYHAYSRKLFVRTKRALLRAIDRPGETGVFHLYGDGGSDDDDPEDLVDSPTEALAEREDAGYRFVIDIPYEFDSDSRDTLIVLRRGYERPIPDWNRRYVSRFEHGEMEVKISNASFGRRLKVRALARVAIRAIQAAR